MALTTKQKSYIDKKSPGKSPKAIAADLKLSEAEVTDYLNERAAKEKTNGYATPIPPDRKRLFFGIMLAIPFLFFILLELGLRLGEYRGNQDLFIFPTVFDGQYGMANPNFTSRYFFSTTSLPSPSDDVFLTHKPENGFRVFVLGGSTANGYPFGYNGSFSRAFRDILQDIAPDRHVEVVNVATSAINSYSIYDQIDEVLAQKPDAVLIYGGHNEYYGALGVGSSETFGAFPGFVRAYLGLQRYKTFMLLRDTIVKATTWMAGFSAPESTRSTSGTLMERMVAQQQITLEDDMYELGKLQFESNLNAIFKKLERNQVPVFMGTLTSNLKDHRPFISIETDKHPAAHDIYDQALQQLGQQDYEAAYQNFVYAKDLDALRFRAPESFNEVIRTVASSYSNTYVVPVNETFKQASEHNLIGFNLMTEHLHPNLSGYHLMGRAFAESFIEADLPILDTNMSLLQDWYTYYDRMQLTEFDERVGNHRIRFLMTGWPFVQERDRSGYPRNYTFESAADSMAYKVVHERVRWDQAKVRLAQHYKDTNRADLALAEYHGLMRGQPYNNSPFIFGARIWLERNNFDEARPLLEQAYTIEPTAFITKMLGAIEVDAGNAERGILLLEESMAFEPDDPQTLFNLSGAYAMKGEFQKADEALVRLERLNPGFPGTRQWRQQLNVHLSQHSSR